MSLSLQGKTALVTAAAQGIGRASAQALAAAGARVIATDIAEDKLKDLASDSISVERLDVLSPDAIAALAERHGAKVDILFNCAGVVHAGTILDCTEKDWNFAFDLNVTAMFRMMRAFLPHMLERGDGTIINMSSVASSVKGITNRFAYQASKAAVVGITKSVAADYVGKGIRCNAIAPATVESPSLRERLEATGDYEAARAAFIARQPIGRIARPEEIADLVVYLAGATYTTGQVHVIDGGWTG
ncbi:NAD(P)-dependent oxidoreductase [Labrys miyagiensis]|uniref:NAD(P)-dependent oxidoreductase n=1 Tax=Labrys miyagiensis TaxID=346912 RepID=A0ABQ6CEC5_9HYPH|nr:SDR family oxidoreductase [Labrys miyagiensis]GLS18723.1 NAD(P)-dependent oxidoreductase [Labrys miyagiensis]